MRWVTLIGVVLVGLLLFTGIVFAEGHSPFKVPPGFEKGKPSDKAEEAIDIHKPITPGGAYMRFTKVHYAKPPWAEKPDEEDLPKDNNAYELLGMSWDLTKYPGGIPYIIDPDYGPVGCVEQVELGYEAWDDVLTDELYAGIVVDASVGPSVDSPDFINTVSWRKVVPPRVIAVTFIWYYPETGEMVDCDVVFNTKKAWGIDFDGEGGGFTLTDAFDVRNIATHEAGHVSGLADLYDKPFSELTMYGYSSEGETKKISLQNGDVLGLEAIY